MTKVKSTIEEPETAGVNRAAKEAARLATLSKRVKLCLGTTGLGLNKNAHKCPACGHAIELKY